ncbi:hypothetical protein COCCADRAFT_24592 [Bipolaris zeicola 26-R-13]|uniref:C2H2-type domain-containing protein n=1 Tax=Cochliobolus carbonum (strain 26-R-13) TaxID=930089 RepID=W6YVL6_COCC2|nr:uncharacterized protein COCCADRAFT_24592 [Bipolaris zeicola 26-R-13]EUC35521.1 hypothetical protein COCCADRAFT_24592 [Bipolaris zeicola 26-R-13]
MTLSVSDQCRSCIAILHEVISALAQPDRNSNNVRNLRMREELDRFSLFVGNIGALHRPESPMSIESRLQGANDVLTHIWGLLDDLKEVIGDLLDIVLGEREEMVSVADETKDECGRGISEVNELQEEISETVTRLFRVSTLIRRATPTDMFAKALSRNRYHFNDQFDISHDHREKLADPLSHHEKSGGSAYKPQIPNIKQSLGSKPTLDRESLPSFFTKATTIAAEKLAPQLNVADESDPDDARSYTTISRSIDSDHESSTNVRIPKLDSLRTDRGKEFECPFCFRIKKFKIERMWKKHVFSDLRPYVCTFPDCDAPYFGDINEWFQHEMTFHRVDYKCFLCARFFNQEEKYILHLKREHEETLDDGGEQTARDLSRKSLAQIPATDCLCCSDWSVRLKEQVIQTSGSVPTGILAVTSTVFKRHLAGHLEQLALFAIPISASTDANNDSNAAVEEAKSKRTDASRFSTLTFSSDRGGVERSTLEIQVDESRGLLHADIQPPERETSASIEYQPSVSSHIPVEETWEKTEQSNRLAALTTLAVALSRSGTWKDAHALYAHVVETSKKKFGLEHHNSRRYTEAEVVYRQALMAYENTLGDEHVQTISTIAELAYVTQELEKWEEVENWYKRSLLSFGSDLGSLLVSMEKYEEAELLCRELLSVYQEKDWHQTEDAFSALGACRKNFGIDSPQSVPLLRELSAALLHQQRLVEAENILRRALKIHEVPFEDSDITILDVMRDLGKVIKMRGRLDGAHAMRMRMADSVVDMGTQAAQAVQAALGTKEQATARQLQAARAAVREREIAQAAAQELQVAQETIEMQNEQDTNSGDTSEDWDSDSDSDDIIF